MPSNISPYVYDIFTAATALGVLLQAAILLGLFLAFRRLQVKIELILDHATEHALPLIASSRATIEELGPRVKIITNNLVEISETVKQESKTIKGSVDDVLEKTRAQTARVDEMVSGTLDGISHASAVIQHGMSIPVRQISGLMNGFRAGFDVLRRKPLQPRVSPTQAMEEPIEVVVVLEEQRVGEKIL